MGNTIYAGCQWAMVIVIAKLGNPSMVGIFVLGLAVTTPVIMLSNLQLRAVQATDATKEYPFTAYWTLRFVMSAIAMLVFIGIVLFSGYRGEKALVILIVGIAKIFESISDVIYGKLQQREMMDRIAISMTIKGVLSLLALGAGIYITNSVVWGSVGLAIAWVLTLCLYDIRCIIPVLADDAKSTTELEKKSPSLRLDLNVALLAKLAKLSLPLGIVMSLTSLNTNLPRYFIERYNGEYELGIFAAMTSLMVVGLTIIGALGQSATPRLARLFSLGKLRQFNLLLLKLIFISFLLGIAGVIVAAFFGKTLLTLLFKPEYSENDFAFTLLMVAAGIGYVGSFLGFGITATRTFHKFLVPYISITAVTLISSALLIPNYEIVGAAWALCCGSIASCVAPFLILISSERLCR